MHFKRIISGVFTALLVVSLNAQSFESIMLKRVTKTNSVSVNFIDKNYFRINNEVVSKQSSSTWWAPDKGRHLVGSMISTVFMAKMGQEIFDQQSDEAKVWGAGITFSLGFAKEIFDSQSKDNRFDIQDLVADIAGIVIGIVLLGVK
jgi:uncharacterized protein YfiM (DUF2279 family)